MSTILWLFSFVVIINLSCENYTTKESSSNINLNNDNNKLQNTKIENKIQLTQFNSINPAYVIPKGLTFSQYYDIYYRNNETVKNLTSDYPNPVGKTERYEIEVENATGIEVIVHLLNVDPTTDFLNLTSLPTDTQMPSKTIILTGKLEKPIKFRFFATTKLKVTFGGWTKKPEHSYSKFLLTYEPYGVLPPVITYPPDTTIPFDELDVISKLIVINQKYQNSTTWYAMKSVLCNATNQYLKSKSLNKIFEPCHQNNITFKSIVKCGSDLPDYMNCIELNLAISLYANITTKVEVEDPFFEEIIPRSPAGLNYTQLNVMWNEFGERYMSEAGFPQYVIPTAAAQMYLWFGVGIGCLLVLFIIGIIALKSGISRKIQNHHGSDQHKILKNSAEIDITMYPSPDQIVPELFPNTGGIKFYNDSNRQNRPNDGGLNTVDEEYRRGGINPAFIHENEAEMEILRLNNRSKSNSHAMSS